MEDYKKKYETALEKARIWKEKSGIPVNKQRILDDIFPELKESEDERIRKELIKHIEANCESGFILFQKVSPGNVIAWLEKQGKKLNIPQDTKDDVRRQSTIQVLEYAKSLDAYNQYGKESINKDIAWLEKQGEQKPTNNIEQKFKVGDWIVDKSGFVQQVLDFRGGIYTCTYNSFTTDCESNYHLWTIQDAKDGDVLTYPDNTIILFKSLHKGNDEGLFIVHCLYFDDIINLTTTCAVADIHPATKEQRETLFKGIHEAGYKWDDETKELKKI